MFTYRRLLLLCPIGAAILIASAIAATPPASPSAPPAKQLESLLKERRDTLRELVEIYDGQFRSGFASKENFLQASNQLLEAELELANSKADRIAIREKSVANWRELERVLAGQHRIGKITQANIFQAKAARLKAEIELLREKTDDPSRTEATPQPTPKDKPKTESAR